MRVAERLDLVGLLLSSSNRTSKVFDKYFTKEKESRSTLWSGSFGVWGAEVGNESKDRSGVFWANGCYGWFVDHHYIISCGSPLYYYILRIELLNII